MKCFWKNKYRKFGLGFDVAEGRHKERKGFPGACFSDSDQVVAFESYWPSLRLNWRRLLESFPLKLIQYLPLKLHFIKFENRIRNWVLALDADFVFVTIGSDLLAVSVFHLIIFKVKVLLEFRQSMLVPIYWTQLLTKATHLHWRLVETTWVTSPLATIGVTTVVRIPLHGVVSGLENASSSAWLIVAHVLLKK